MSCSDDKIYICRCEEVTREDIEKAIADGATTLAGIKKRTHAGMGLCQGRTCSKLITRILAEHGIKPADVYPQTSRPPVRTAKIGDFVEEDDV